MLTEEQIKTFRGHRSFQVVEKRWIVERSFAWLTFQRRLNRDYDFLPETTESWVHLAFIRMMIRRLAAVPLQAAAYPPVSCFSNSLSHGIPHIR